MIERIHVSRIREESQRLKLQAGASKVFAPKPKPIAPRGKHRKWEKGAVSLNKKTTIRDIVDPEEIDLEATAPKTSRPAVNNYNEFERDYDFNEDPCNSSFESSAKSSDAEKEPRSPRGECSETESHNFSDLTIDLGPGDTNRASKASGQDEATNKAPSATRESDICSSGAFVQLLSMATSNAEPSNSVVSNTAGNEGASKRKSDQADSQIPEGLSLISLSSSSIPKSLLKPHTSEDARDERSSNR